MDADSRPLCFHCGQPTGSHETLNRLPSGEPCPHCRARLLEELPPALPGMGKGMPAGYGALGAEPYDEEERPGARLIQGSFGTDEADDYPDDPIAG